MGLEGDAKIEVGLSDAGVRAERRAPCRHLKSEMSVRHCLSGIDFAN